MTDHNDDGPTVTESDVGRPVVDAGEGHQVGTIAGVEGDAVYVAPDPSPDLGDAARASLGWEDADDDVTYVVSMDEVVRDSRADVPVFRVDLAALGRE